MTDYVKIWTISFGEKNHIIKKYYYIQDIIIIFYYSHYNLTENDSL